MLRTMLLFAVLALPFVAFGQTPPKQAPSSVKTNVQPITPPPRVNVYGGSGYGSGGGATVAGSALNGMASVISAQGDRNLSNSAANINNQQAASMYIQNRQEATNAYFEMRAANTAYRKAERGPPATMEQMARFAKDGAPKPLTASEIDPVNGRVYWPEMLQADLYADDRGTMDSLLAKRASYGVLGFSEQSKARTTADSMLSTMKSQIREVPPELYVASKNFLQSLTYSLTKTDLD